MSTTYILVVFAIVIVAMIVLIAKFKVNAVTSLLLAAIVLGVAIGTPLGDMESTINGAFASTIEDIGIVILLGCILGKMLEETGAAQAICTSAIKIVGQKNVIWAIAFSAFVLGIPVFSDTVTILLTPIVSKLAVETGVSMMAYGSALSVGAQITHALVPPTPGPLAAAAALGVPLGQAILWGLIVSFPALIATVFWCKFIGSKEMVYPKKEYMKDEPENVQLPSTTLAYMPIVVPLLLIVLQNIFTQTMPDSGITSAFMFIGSPLCALLIGCVLAMMLTGPRWHTKEVLSDWVDDSMSSAAMPLFITGMGGALAAFVKNAGVAEKIAQGIVDAGVPGLILPIILAILLHVITGSTTLAVLTAAQMTQPMLATLGITPLSAFLACAAGSFVFKHGNSSAFWVGTSMANMSFTQGLKSIGGGCTVAGLTACVCTFILNAVGVI